MKNLELKRLNTEYLNLEETPSFIDTAFSHFSRQIAHELEQRLKAYLTENLKTIGHVFNSNEEFEDFIRQRVTRIEFEERPHFFEFYLDFINQDERGRCIGSYFDEVRFRYEGNKVIATVG